MLEYWYLTLSLKSPTWLVDSWNNSIVCRVEYGSPLGLDNFESWWTILGAMEGWILWNLYGKWMPNTYRVTSGIQPSKGRSKNLVFGILLHFGANLQKCCCRSTVGQDIGTFLVSCGILSKSWEELHLAYFLSYQKLIVKLFLCEWAHAFFRLQCN